MTRQELAVSICKNSRLTGTFTLRSGQISHEYFDKYLFEADPILLRSISHYMRDSIPQGTHVLAGLELGGVPLAAVLSLESGLPAAFVRKKAKEYGTCKLAEGAQVDGKKVCVVEDVVTTGGQILESVAELRSRGAIIDTVLCVIVRNPKAYEILAEQGLTLKALYTMDELLEANREAR